MKGFHVHSMFIQWRFNGDLHSMANIHSISISPMLLLSHFMWFPLNTVNSERIPCSFNVHSMVTCTHWMANINSISNSQILLQSHWKQSPANTMGKPLIWWSTIEDIKKSIHSSGHFGYNVVHLLQWSVWL